MWDLYPAAREKFSELGVTIGASAADVGAQSDLVMLCLPRSADVRQLLFSDQGLASGLSPGKIVVDQTSGFPPETAGIAAELAGAGVSMIDAAVSGSPGLVHEGLATLMVSGEEEVVRRAEPTLNLITQKIIRCGSRVGDAQAMKMINNAMYGVLRLATLEAVALGLKAGVPLVRIEEFLRDGPAANRTTELALPALLQGKSATKFSLALMLKDIDQAAEMGERTQVPTPFISTVSGLLRVGINTLGPQSELEDTIPLMGQLSGVSMKSTDGERSATTATPIGAEEEARVLDKIEALLTVMGHLATYECASIGLAYGLTLDDIDKVVNNSSGRSAASRAVLPALASGAPLQLPTLEHLLARMAEACALATTLKTPLFLGAIGKSLLAQRLLSGKLGDDISTMLHFYSSPRQYERRPAPRSALSA
ncbi:hypothetical protein ASB57_15760 [Bordetella sp. N]|nr:hypothetical protein ASB57_15760 [Bordetella sp. N]